MKKERTISKRSTFNYKINPLFMCFLIYARNSTISAPIVSGMFESQQISVIKNLGTNYKSRANTFCQNLRVVVQNNIY